MELDSSTTNDEIIKLRAKLRGNHVEISSSLARNSNEQNDNAAKLQIKIGMQDVATWNVQAQITGVVAENNRQNNNMVWALEAQGKVIQSVKVKSLGFAQTIANLRDSASAHVEESYLQHERTKDES